VKVWEVKYTLGLGTKDGVIEKQEQDIKNNGNS
jgi:hypothetical protein